MSTKTKTCWLLFLGATDYKDHNCLRSRTNIGNKYSPKSGIANGAYRHTHFSKTSKVEEKMPDDEDESPAINANERTKNRKMGRLGALIGAVDVGSVR